MFRVVEQGFAHHAECRPPGITRFKDQNWSQAGTDSPSFSKISSSKIIRDRDVARNCSLNFNSKARHTVGTSQCCYLEGSPGQVSDRASLGLHRHTTHPAVSLILSWSESPLRRPAPNSRTRQSPRNRQQWQLVQQQHEPSSAVLTQAGQRRLIVREARFLFSLGLVFLDKKK